MLGGNGQYESSEVNGQNALLKVKKYERLSGLAIWEALADSEDYRSRKLSLA